jgi:hypothetical protein
MGAAESAPAADTLSGTQPAQPAADVANQDSTREDTAAKHDEQFVLLVTVPPGTGKERLMGTFVSRYIGRIAYVAKVGAVKTSEPVRSSAGLALCSAHQTRRTSSFVRGCVAVACAGLDRLGSHCSTRSSHGPLLGLHVCATLRWNHSGGESPSAPVRPDLASLQGLVYTYRDATVPTPDPAPAPPGEHATVTIAAAAALRAGKSVVIDADTDGARALRAAAFPAAYVFVLPESGAALRAGCDAEVRRAAGADAGPSGDGSQSRNAEHKTELSRAVDAQVASTEREIAELDAKPQLYDFRVTNDEKGSGAVTQLVECAQSAFVAEQVRLLLPQACQAELSHDSDRSIVRRSANVSAGSYRCACCTLCWVSVPCVSALQVLAMAREPAGSSPGAQARALSTASSTPLSAAAPARDSKPPVPPPVGVARTGGQVASGAAAHAAQQQRAPKPVEFDPAVDGVL